MEMPLSGGRTGSLRAPDGGLGVVEKPGAELVIKALDMAYEQSGRPQGLLFHSDSSQYSSSDWRSFLKANNLVARLCTKSSETHLNPASVGSQ